MTLYSFRLIILLGALFALSCSPSTGPEVRGGGTEDVNTKTVTCRIVNTSGEPVFGATVKLRPAEYLAGETGGSIRGSAFADTVTDDQGQFQINGLDVGRYCIEVAGRESTATLIRVSVDQAADTFNLGIDTVRNVASVKGTIAGSAPATSMIAQIYGLDRVAIVDTLTGQFVFAGLPSGTYDIRILPASREYGCQVTSTGVIAPGQTVSLPPVQLHSSSSEDYTGWVSSRKIPLSRPSSDLTGFPLLVRLSSSSFDFSAARDRGIDIRFSSSAGKKLPFEIESWDSAAGRAAIWVLVDTIRANVDSQFVIMHWGNLSAPDFSNSAAVFDTAAGFCGVWHLGGQAPCDDATGWNNILTADGTNQTPGVIDGSRQFTASQADSMRAEYSPSLEPQSFSVSVWFLRRGGQMNFAKILNKGDQWTPFQSYTLEMRAASNIAGFQTGRIDSSFVFLETGPVIADNTWYFLCGTFNQLTGEQILYLDGVPVDTAVSNVPIRYNPEFRRALYLGAQQTDANGAFFNGNIDEARVERVVRTTTWIRECYENQKP